MQENRRVRLIRKRDRPHDESPAKPSGPESKEREIKTIVSRWVSEHRLRSEEVRRTLTTIFGVTAS
jgi:hypothetical protein